MSAPSPAHTPAQARNSSSRRRRSFADGFFFSIRVFRYLRLEHMLQRTYFDYGEAYPGGTNKERRRQQVA